MKFSYNWINELTEGLEADPRKLGQLITMKTAECEGVEMVGAHLGRVCAARVISVTPLGAGHNQKVDIDTQRYGIKTVVCGAENCRPEMVSAYVPCGTVLGGNEIHKISIDGVESDGMLASGAELGINRDASGILDLDAAPGEPIPGCVPDAIIEIDNKSLTHRPDLWGHHGMAREVAAILGKPLLDPARLDRIPSEPAPIKIAIENLQLGPRYSALAFENVTVQPSPLWLQYRLEAIGLNPINNIVDVTNFVMAELTQPMHAFDWDTLHGDTIFVRPARDKEWILALNGEEYHFSSSDLVIADGRCAIALAGVIGGLDTSINDKTTRIVLESANFEATTIRKTSSRLKLRTDASMRFEKAQDPENTVRGLARALELLEEISPGIRLVGGLADQRAERKTAPPIRLPMDWLIRKLGRDISPEDVRDILERLEFGVEEDSPSSFSVTVPSWRATRDVSIKDDLVEEVGRMVGYDSIPPQAPLVAAHVPLINKKRMFHRQVRTKVSAQGFHEVYNYSFISEDLARDIGFDPGEHLRVANPISSEQGLMRNSLLPGIYKNILDNSKHFPSFQLFEIGYEIHKAPSGLPNETPHLMAAVYSKEDDVAGLLRLKRVAEILMETAEVCPAEARAFEHPARSGEVFWCGNVVGRLFELHPSLVSGRARVLDLDLAIMQSLQPPPKRYLAIGRFPSSAFDLSVLAGHREAVGDLRRQLVALAGETLDQIEFLREYKGSPLPDDVKSVSFRLTLAARDRTLSSEEVGEIRARIIEGMRSVGYELRV